VTPVPSTLERARQIVEPEIEAAVTSLCPELIHPVRYHFGWEEVDGSPSLAKSGKGLRPALAVLSAEAVGAPAATGALGAVAVELIHNFSLIHDDIIDGDTKRRHRATVWKAFSVDDAVISGDALHTLAFQVLLEEPSSEKVEAASRLAKATTLMLAGQAADMAFNNQPVVTFEDCVSMEAGKTGALLGCAASIGAVLSRAQEAQIVALDNYGQKLGIAFQAVDDILGIWGNPEITGKPAGNDLRERKKSMPVAFTLSLKSSESEELEAMYAASNDLNELEIKKAMQLIEEAGGRERTQDEAQTQLKGALEALHSAEFHQRPLEELKEIAIFVRERDH
tara:strand:+ start:1429 stop:2442 length:1014 start_codon:yes stop_codon:yes gene_type:complete